MRHHDEEAKFWSSPELVNHLLSFLDTRSTAALTQIHKNPKSKIQKFTNLLSFLDTSSIAALAQIHPLTVSLLQIIFNWRGFVRKTQMKGGSKYREVEGKKSFELEVMEEEVAQVVVIFMIIMIVNNMAVILMIMTII